MKTGRLLIGVATGILFFVSHGRAARIAAPLPGVVSDAQVVQSIKNGVDYLLKSRKIDNWEATFANDKKFRGGETAVALYALLAARQALWEDDDYRRKLDPYGQELWPVVQWLEKEPLEGTYPAGYRAAALSYVPRSGDRKADDALQDALENCKNYLALAIGAEGGYSYTKGSQGPVDHNRRIAAAKRSYDDAVKRVQAGQTDPLTKKRIPYSKEEAAQILEGPKKDLAWAEMRFSPTGDLSNARCATMGAAALAESGLGMPKIYWDVTDRFWRLTQQAEGGWGYMASNTGEPKASMSVGAVASLLIAREFLDADGAAKSEKNVENGLGWLGKAGDFKWDDFYTMHTLVRIGILTGRKNLVGANWYAEGATWIVRSQQGDGSIRGGHGAVVSTALGLLFLSQGRQAILWNKLDYGTGSNAHPRDVYGAARSLGKTIQRQLGWQWVDLKMPADAWTDAPILVITGVGDPKFRPADLEKIRAYIAAGGTVFSAADSSSAAFTVAIKKYGPEVVEKKSDFRPLTKDHKFFAKESGAEFNGMPALIGINDGTREVWIHCAADVGSDWQARKAGKSMDLAGALYAYVRESGLLRYKLGKSAAVK